MFLKKSKSDVLRPENIVLNAVPDTMENIIRRAGTMLTKSGYCEAPYIEGMLRREKLTSTNIGAGLAIPHGVGDSVRYIRKSGICILQYPGGVPFGENKEPVSLVIGIAGKDDMHLNILMHLAELAQDEAKMKILFTTSDKNLLMKSLTEGM